MNKQLEAQKNIINSSSIWFLIIGVSAITLHFNTKAYDPFNTPKLIVLLLLSGWLLGHILNHYRRAKFRLNKKEFIFILVPLLFVITQFIALFFTDIFLVGLLGDTQRRNGFLSYFALTTILIFCTIAINYYYALRVLKTAIIIGAILCMYGFMQISGKDFVSWNNPYNSMIITMGNPNFASSLLAILTVISLLSIFINEISKSYKLIAVLVIFTSIFLIIKSQSRQGLLVIFFSLLFYVTFLICIRFKKLRISVITSSLAISALAILGMLQVGPLTSLLYKDSVTVRGYYWRAAWQMFLDKPLTGIGLDRYGAYFKQFRDSSYPLNYGYDITSSNAHNVYLQLLGTGGLFVGLSYLVLIILIFVAGIQNILKTSGSSQRFNLTFLATWIGFQAQSLISIDNLGISIWGWLLAGCILGINLNSLGVTSIKRIDSNRLVMKKTLSLFQPTVSALFLIPIFILSLNLQRFETNTLLAKMYANPSSPANKPIVSDYSKKVINNPFADPFYKFVVSLYMVDMGDIEASYKVVSSLHKQDPRNLEYIEWLIEYEKNQMDLEKQLEYRKIITKYDPWNAENYLEMGLIYKQKGDLIRMNNIRELILGFAAETEIAIKAARQLT